MSCRPNYDPCLDSKLNQIGSYAAAARSSATNAAASAESSEDFSQASATSATQANNYLTQVENIFEDFDERYLGAKAAAPIVDNQGNPLQEGAMYWNSVANSLYVWDGSVWVALPTGFNEFTNFLATGTPAARNLVTRTADVVNVLDFGAVGDGITDNSAAIAAAIATGKPVWFPENGANQYRFSTSITTSNDTEIYTDNSVQLYYTGATGAAVNLVGSKVKVSLGEVLAPNAPYAIRYYNLEFSEIEIRRPGMCQQACIYHDGDLQTANAGNNRWTVEDIQAGSIPYGIRIKNSTAFILEGEIWDVKVIFSATTTGIRIGESPANNLCRWNTYRVAVDAQGITPILVDVYQDSNFIELINWAGLVAPPIAHVRFNVGTGNNFLFSGAGVQDPIVVLDSGSNFWTGSANAGERVLGGKVLVYKDASSGIDACVVQNTSTANNTTKYIGNALWGRDLLNTGKQVASFRANPIDPDWNDSYIEIKGRISDTEVSALTLYGFGDPEGVVSAPVGSIYTRRDGGSNTTLYVKESGSGNTGWTAK
jgi:hypothetical protein